MALLEICGEHPAAEALFHAVTLSAKFSAWNQLLTSEATTLCDIASQFGSLRNVATLGAVEELARQETSRWEPCGLADRVSRALEAIAPERAAPLYQAQMVETNRANVQIVAAGSLLRVQRTNESAFRLLTNYLDQSVHHLQGMAADQLQEAGARFLPTLITWRDEDSNRPRSYLSSSLDVAIKRIELRALEESSRIP